MIKGIGVDILDIGRMEKIIEKDDRFVKRVFTEEEISYCDSKVNKAQHYAARLRLKKLFLKPWGVAGVMG